MSLARLVASGFGSGLAPLAAGTVGTAVALLLGVGLMQGPAWLLPLAAAAASLGGIWAVQAAGAAGDDPGWVVIDEFAGMWITLLALPRPTLPGLALAFLLFRLIDITKPGPVGWADRQKTAAGVMGDDVIAGALAAGIIWALLARWPHLLG